MINWIKNLWKKYYDSEFEGSIEFEFSIYDVALLLIIVLVVIKLM
jgi:hypothetical protein